MLLLAVNKLTRPANPRASDAMATEVCTEDLVDMDEDVDMEEQARNRGTPVDMVTAAVVGLACGYSSRVALAETQRRHDAREDAAWPLQTPQPSPQTAIQRAQVELLLAAVEQEEKIDMRSTDGR